jgi:hypothetical protein
MKGMEKFLTDNIIGVSIIISVAFFSAFRIGRIYGTSNLSQNLLELKLEKLKQKTEFLLRNLWKEYYNTSVNLEVPEEVCFKDVVELSIKIDENVTDKILALNNLYLDLTHNGTQSVYFEEFMRYLGT